MEQLQTRCPNCGGNLVISADFRNKVCPYCDSVFEIENVNDSGNIGRQPINTREVADMVRNICVSSELNTSATAVGFSLINYKKYEKAKRYFGIAEGEFVYLIYDDTVLGSCKKGFAICTTGLYYRTGSANRPYVIRWSQFKQVSLECGSCLKINDAEFFPVKEDKKPLYQILEKIRQNL